jgi:septal ring-binding cell division protein DamX
MISLVVVTACSNKPKQNLPEGSVQAISDSNSYQQWYCKGDKNEQWRCSDLSVTEPPHPEKQDLIAPAIYNPINTTPKKVTQKKLTPATTQPKAVITGVQLKSKNKNTYAVQLIAAQQQKTIERFKQKNPQLPTQLITVEKNEVQWQLLLLGVYPSYAQAKAAIAAISPPLTNTPWVRTLTPMERQKINQPARTQ